MKRTGAAAIVLFLACCSAQAGTLYRWIDAKGQAQISRERPSLGVAYTEIQIPDGVRWDNRVAMPDERDVSAKLTPQELFRQASPSVYWVMAAPPDQVGGRLSQGLRDGASVVYGSAVAISEDQAITNCHVVAGAGQEAVLGSGGEEATGRLEIVGANIEEDRCIVRTRDLRLAPVTGVRRFDSLEIGEPVFAIGNPRRMEKTFSDGMLSGKRVLPIGRVLQTTAPISPGSSGGGLFDSRGNLVGITTSTLRGAQAINFAIPAEDFWK